MAPPGLTVADPSLVSAIGESPGALPVDRPNIVDLSLAPHGPWPTVGDIGLSLAVLALHIALTNSFYGTIAGICGGLLAALFVLVTARYLRTRPNRLPWLEIIFGVHYVQFGLPVLAEPCPAKVQGQIPMPESQDSAAAIALFAGLALIAAFAVTRWASRGLKFDNLFPKLDPTTLASGARIYVPIAAAFVMLSAVFPGIHVVLRPVLGIISAFFWHNQLMVVATAAYLALPNRGTMFLMLGAWTTMAVQLAISSSLSELCIPLIAVAALWWRARERLPVAAIAVVATVMIILQPVKTHYRSLRWVDNADIGVMEAWSQAFSTAAAEAHSGYGSLEAGYRHEGVQATVDRLNGLAGLAYTIEMVPAVVPYTGGMIYPMMIAAWTPRILWPNKPDMTKYALDPFVIALNIVTPDEAETTTTAISLPAQGYLEHGIPGSIGWMSLFGVVLGLISRYYGTKLAGTVAGTVLLAGWILASEGGFYNVFGSLWQSLVATPLLTWLLWILGRGNRSREIPLLT